MNAPTEAIENANAYLNNVGLPTYRTVLDTLAHLLSQAQLSNLGPHNSAVLKSQALLNDVLLAQRTESRSKPVAYTGHGANTGGLQAHSIGDLFPLGIVGIGSGDRTYYAAVNYNDNERGPCRLSYEAALQDINNGRIFDARKIYE